MTIFYILAGIAGFAIFFVAMWTGVLHLIAATGGWSRLARIYPGNALAKSGDKNGQTASGKSYNWVSMQLGWFAQYSSVLVVTVMPQGLHIEPMFMFKVAHPPLQIPWSAIVSCTSSQLLFAHRTRLSVRARDGTSVTSITLFGKCLSQDIEDHWRHASAQSVL